MNHEWENELKSEAEKKTDEGVKLNEIRLPVNYQE